MHDENLHDMFSKITPDNSLQDRIMDRIEGQEMKKSTIKKTGRTVMVAAALIAALATSAFAMTPTGQETISSIIAYFQNDHATEMTSMEELAKYNEEIGKSFSKDGYTLTLDNVAADDNFVHVFYTIKSDSVPFYEGDTPKASMYSDAVRGPQMNVDIAINGEMAGWNANHNTVDGYFVDNYTYKSAAKYNVAGMDIPDIFKVELFGEVVQPDGELSETYLKLFKMDGYAEMTEEDKASLWYVAADVDKAKVKVESVTKDINAKLTWVNGTLEKAVFSPFGNQLVISTEASADSDAALRADLFALFDENGTSLDIINTDLRGGMDGSSRNSLEFLKADKDTSKLKLVPLKFNEHGDANVPELPVGTYPLTYKVNNYGSVVVTDIRFKDGEIDIDYYKDGFVMYDPGFDLMDVNGERVEPGGKLGCVLYHDVHYDTNSYTARYVYDACDDKGNPIPMGEECKAENLKNAVKSLGVVEQMYVELDYDNALEVSLK